MTLSRIKLERFSAFAQLDLEISPGINIFVGENGTGKTHLMKVAYAACDITKTQGSFAAKLIRTFMPYEGRIGRLVHRAKGSSRAVVEIYQGRTKLRSSFSNHSKEPNSAKITGRSAWLAEVIESAFVPVKEVLVNAPGFRSLYSNREIAYEEVYADIFDRAFLPLLRGPYDRDRRELMASIQALMDGKVVQKNEHFFLKNGQGELEFSLLAEGLRKLALIWLLIQNGTLLSGSVLFWDEPEANLNPVVMGHLVEVLLALQRMGVQILLATHDYVLLKEFHLRSEDRDQVVYHALARGPDRSVQHSASEDFLGISPNVILDTFGSIYDREIERSLKVRVQR